MLWRRTGSFATGASLTSCASRPCRSTTRFPTSILLRINSWAQSAGNFSLLWRRARNQFQCCAAKHSRPVRQVKNNVEVIQTRYFKRGNRKSRSLQPRSIVSALAFEFARLVFTPRYDSRYRTTNRQIYWAQTNSGRARKMQWCVDVSSHQRFEIVDAAEQYRAGDCIFREANGFLPSSHEHHCSQMRARGIARHKNPRAIESKLVSPFIKPRHRPAALIDDFLHPSFWSQRVIDGCESDPVRHRIRRGKKRFVL